MTWLAALWDILAAWLAYRQRHRGAEDWWTAELARTAPESRANCALSNMVLEDRQQCYGPEAQHRPNCALSNLVEEGRRSRCYGAGVPHRDGYGEPIPPEVDPALVNYVRDASKNPRGAE